MSSQPIPISGGHHARARSASESSQSSAGTPPPQTPPRRLSMTLPRVVPSAGAPGTSPTSPILSFFLNGSSPTNTVKSPTAYPFARNPFCGTVEDEDSEEPPVVKHARRASSAAIAPGRFGVPVVNPAAPGTLQSAQQDRGTGVLRRLSLSGAFVRPPIPTQQPAPAAKKPTTPPPIMEARGRQQRRRATLGVSAGPPRAPSPMGERILKGHFDGFN